MACKPFLFKRGTDTLATVASIHGCSHPVVFNLVFSCRGRWHAETRIAELKKDAYEFKRDVVVGGENPRTGRTVAEKVCGRKRSNSIIHLGLSQHNTFGAAVAPLNPAKPLEGPLPHLPCRLRCLR